MKGKAIGGSEIAAICGSHPYQTPYDIWLDKTSETKEFDGNKYTEAGNLLEPLILKNFSDKKGIILSKAQHKFVHDKLDYCICFVDNISDTDKYIVSAKNTSKEIDAQNIPEYWLHQINFEMGLSKTIHEGYICWLSRGVDFGYSPLIKFDEELFEEQLRFAEIFWTEFVLKNIAPPPFNSEEIIGRIKVEAITKDANEDLINTIILLKETKAELKKFEATKSECEEKIKMFLVEADTLLHNGKALVTWKQNKEGKEFDKKGFEEGYPDLFAEFVKPKKGARVLLIK